MSLPSPSATRRTTDLAGLPIPVLVGKCPECGGEAVFRFWDDEDGQAWRAGACLADERTCWWSEAVRWASTPMLLDSEATVQMRISEGSCSTWRASYSMRVMDGSMMGAS